MLPSSYGPLVKKKNVNCPRYAVGICNKPSCKFGHFEKLELKLNRIEGPDKKKKGLKSSLTASSVSTNWQFKMLPPSYGPLVKKKNVNCPMYSVGICSNPSCQFGHLKKFKLHVHRIEKPDKKKKRSSSSSTSVNVKIKKEINQNDGPLLKKNVNCPRYAVGICNKLSCKFGHFKKFVVHLHRIEQHGKKKKRLKSSTPSSTASAHYVEIKKEIEVIDLDDDDNDDVQVHDQNQELTFIKIKKEIEQNDGEKSLKLHKKKKKTDSKDKSNRNRIEVIKLGNDNNDKVRIQDQKLDFEKLFNENDDFDFKSSHEDQVEESDDEEYNKSTKDKPSESQKQQKSISTVSINSKIGENSSNKKSLQDTSENLTSSGSKRLADNNFKKSKTHRRDTVQSSKPSSTSSKNCKESSSNNKGKKPRLSSDKGKKSHHHHTHHHKHKEKDKKKEKKKKSSKSSTYNSKEFDKLLNEIDKIQGKNSSDEDQVDDDEEILPDTTIKSNIEYQDRKTMLQRFYEECVKIYPKNRAHARARALLEETELAKRCQPRMYRSSAAATILSIRRNEVNVNTADVHEGLNKNDLSGGGAQDPNQLYKLMYRYVLSNNDLIENGYPRPNPNGIHGHVITKLAEFQVNKSDSNLKVCHRCTKEFEVDILGFPVKKQEKCFYHPGQRFKTIVNGFIEERLSCCGGDVSTDTDGCSISNNHVFGGSNRNLCDFVSAVLDPGDIDCIGRNLWDIIALDCKMIYTTQGLELARVTVAGVNSQIIYDQYVKSTHPVFDYNTHVSGIRKEDLVNEETTILDVQAVFLANIRPNSIIIGHSLESDLLALKFGHNCCIDTAVLFPHKMGLPFKRTLGDLSSEILGKIIQVSDLGHDSSEDAARSALELVLWKIKNTKEKAANFMLFQDRINPNLTNYSKTTTINAQNDTQTHAIINNTQNKSQISTTSTDNTSNKDIDVNNKNDESQIEATPNYYVENIVRLLRTSTSTTESIKSNHGLSVGDMKNDVELSSDLSPKEGEETDEMYGQRMYDEFLKYNDFKDKESRQKTLKRKEKMYDELSSTFDGSNYYNNLRKRPRNLPSSTITTSTLDKNRKKNPSHSSQYDAFTQNNTNGSEHWKQISRNRNLSNIRQVPPPISQNNPNQSQIFGQQMNSYHHQNNWRPSLSFPPQNRNQIRSPWANNQTNYNPPPLLNPNNLNLGLIMNNNTMPSQQTRPIYIQSNFYNSNNTMNFFQNCPRPNQTPIHIPPPQFLNQQQQQPGFYNQNVNGLPSLMSIPRFFQPQVAIEPKGHEARIVRDPRSYSYHYLNNNARASRGDSNSKTRFQTRFSKPVHRHIPVPEKQLKAIRRNSIKLNRNRINRINRNRLNIKLRELLKKSTPARW